MRGTDKNTQENVETGILNRRSTQEWTGQKADTNRLKTKLQRRVTGSWNQKHMKPMEPRSWSLGPLSQRLKDISRITSEGVNPTTTKNQRTQFKPEPEDRSHGQT